MKRFTICLASILMLHAPAAWAGTVLVKADLNAVATPAPVETPPAKPEKPKTAAEKKAEAKKAALQAAKEAAKAAKEAKEAKALAKKGKKPPIPLDDPRALELAKDDFLVFAKTFLLKCERLGLDTQGRTNVTQEGGQFVAVHKEILMDTIHVEVKRPEEGSDMTPFVGHLIYDLAIHQGSGATKEAALSGANETKTQTMREIFRYDKKKKAWIE
ncbi:MAG: hypothetical protein HQK81_13200 [Desulfovibrionaceae bacterium]|nr:hypothetical protein [Desulfovibrionaceae bacterium]MBF0515002.1 hypothetical protein [Desulfovibrionaceae bacterium]